MNDDGPKRCPDCERPNQFGELCERCNLHYDDNEPDYGGAIGADGYVYSDADEGL